MNKASIALSTALIATAIMTGCNSKTESAAQKPTAQVTETAQATQKTGPFVEWNPAEILKNLQGTFKVKNDTWVVADNKVTITSGDKTTEATLNVTAPCQIKVMKEIAGGGFSADNYGIAFNGKEIYLGLGTYGMKFGNKYIVNKDGVVTFDGTTCNFYAADFGGKYKEPVAVKGEITKDGGKKMFNFEIPNRYKEGEFKSYSVEVVGTALLNSQAKGNMATL